MLKEKKAYCESLIKHLEQEGLAVSMLFVTKEKNNEYQVYKANLNEEVGNSLQKVCSSIVRKSYRKPDEKQFRQYDPSKKTSEYTEFLSEKELSEIKPILNLIEAERIELKTIESKFLEKLWFYVICLEDKNDRVLFFKKYSKGMVLQKSIGLALLFKEGDFDKIKNDIFMISKAADCIYYKEQLIIRSKGNFEKIFNFIRRIVENAHEAIKLIKKLPFKIAKFEDFETRWMRNEIMMRKLNNIYATRSLEKIIIKNITQLTRQGILKYTKIDKDDTGKLVIASSNDWEMLNILDDAYVKSMLTNIQYEAGAKREIGR